MIRFIYYCWSKFLTFIGDVEFFGWKHPFWFIINCPDYKLKGEHFREVDKIIQPGDVILTRSENYIDKWLIPGYWTHCAFYFGGEKNRVIHAISDGVVIEDIINIMRTDKMIVLRPESKYVERALALAKNMINQEYDFLFNFNDSSRLSCSELIFCCYPQLLQAKKRFGKMTVVADDIVDSKNFHSVWDSRS